MKIKLNEVYDSQYNLIRFDLGRGLNKGNPELLQEKCKSSQNGITKEYCQIFLSSWWKIPLKIVQVSEGHFFFMIVWAVLYWESFFSLIESISNQNQIDIKSKSNWHQIKIKLISNQNQFDIKSKSSWFQIKINLILNPNQIDIKSKSSWFQIKIRLISNQIEWFLQLFLIKNQIEWKPIWADSPCIRNLGQRLEDTTGTMKFVSLRLLVPDILHWPDRQKPRSLLASRVMEQHLSGLISKRYSNHLTCAV